MASPPVLRHRSVALLEKRMKELEALVADLQGRIRWLEEENRRLRERALEELKKEFVELTVVVDKLPGIGSIASRQREEDEEKIREVIEVDKECAKKLRDARSYYDSVKKSYCFVLIPAGAKTLWAIHPKYNGVAEEELRRAFDRVLRVAAECGVRSTDRFYLSFIKVIMRPGDLAELLKHMRIDELEAKLREAEDELQKIRERIYAEGRRVELLRKRDALRKRVSRYREELEKLKKLIEEVTRGTVHVEN